MSVSDRRAERVEAFQVQGDEGLCSDAWKTGAPVHAGDLAAHQDRWPVLVPAAARAGFAGAHALPISNAGAAIDTATGMPAATGGLPIADAARALHEYSRATNTRPTEAAHALIRRTLAPENVLRRTTNAEANPASASVARLGSPGRRDCPERGPGCARKQPASPT
ncbi:hypothetical protein ACIA6C_13320 [Streptomyces sp. NPDC051578]|uniref:hypothetical protein n=1 Tax=Streptomyces sp. NPDC051578 TaxID=3365662 RepID=UPI0037906B44